MGSVEALSVVSSKLPDPPYPPDTHVRGWKFQIDHERLFASDTWAIAPQDMRPWLLMLWHTAWTQRPAGSFPSDREIISAKIGMDKRLFDAHADILLRGFVRHSDSRLYHSVIVEQVLQFQEHNRKERDRVAAWRAQRNAYVTRNKHVSTTPEPEPEPEPKDYSTTVESDFAPAKPRSRRHPNCPFEDIVSLYHEILPELRAVEKLTTKRRDYIRQRWQEDLPTLDHWRNYFSFVRKSKFLMG